jgi:hypothetical protein
MRYSKLSLLVPCALLLSACTTVTPVYKDNGTRSGSCVEGGPDSVAQQFYDYRIQHRNNDLTPLRPYLSDNLAKLLTDASRDNAHRDLFNSDPFSSALRYRTVPASPAHRLFRIVMHATFRYA